MSSKLAWVGASMLLVACTGSHRAHPPTTAARVTPGLPSAPAWCTTEAGPPPRFDRPASPALAMLDEMEAAGDDASVHEAALRRLDGLVAEHPEDAEAHFVRGYALALLGRTENARVAYERAVELEPRLSDAIYSLGVALSALGRAEESLARFTEAARIDPTFVNAHYNAGQTAYGLGRFDVSLEHFLCAHANAPEDFRAARKVVQALHALGRFDEGASGRELLRRTWSASRDPAVRGERRYVIDQLVVGGEQVMVFENPAVSDGDLDYVFIFACVRDGRPTRTVQLETSSVIREHGTPYVLGYDEGNTHGTTGPFFEAMPRYEVLRPIAVDLIERLQAGAARPATTSTAR